MDAADRQSHGRAQAVVTRRGHSPAVRASAGAPVDSRPDMCKYRTMADVTWFAADPGGATDDGVTPYDFRRGIQGAVDVAARSSPCRCAASDTDCTIALASTH